MFFYVFSNVLINPNPSSQTTAIIHGVKKPGSKLLIKALAAAAPLDTAPDCLTIGKWRAWPHWQKMR